MDVKLEVMMEFANRARCHLIWQSGRNSGDLKHAVQVYIDEGLSLTCRNKVRSIIRRFETGKLKKQVFKIICCYKLENTFY